MIEKIKRWFVPSTELLYKLIELAWRLPPVQRRYCWASAVAWAYVGGAVTGADRECWYCAGCKAAAELREKLTADS